MSSNGPQGLGSPRLACKPSSGRSNGCIGMIEREYSFVDATSFDVMRTLHLREALAFDGDFTAVGYLELRP